MTRLDALVETIAALEERVTRLTGAQHLTGAVIQDGQLTAEETVAVVDEAGDPVVDEAGLSVVETRPVVSIGVQADGSTTVVHHTGTTPWTPSPPTVVETTGGLAVVWDGLYMDDEDTDVDESKEAYADFQRVEVHAGPDDTPASLDYEIDSVTRIGTIETPTGGQVALALEPGRYWIALVAFNKAGEPGEPSYATYGSSLAAATPADVDAVMKSASGKNTIVHSYSDPDHPGTAVGDTWFRHHINDGSVIAQWQWEGYDWQPAKLASEVIASLDVGKLTTGELAAGQRIIAGPRDGAHAELNPAGFSTWRKPTADSEDQAPYKTIQLGQDGADDSLQLLDASGSVVAGISSDGRISGSTLEITGVDSGSGTPDSGILVYGRELREILDDLPRGIIAGGYLGSNHIQSWSHGTEVGLGEVSFVQAPDRTIEAVFSGGAWYTDTAGDVLVVRMRATTDGSAPTTSSAVVATAFAPAAGASGRAMAVPPLYASGTWGNPGSTVRLLITVQRFYGTGKVTITTYGGQGHFTPYRITVRDTGRDITETWQMNTGGASWDSTAAPTAPVVKKTYVSTWKASSAGVYNSSGALLDRAGKVQQGYYSATNGDTKSIVAFSAANSTGGETGKTISQAITGAKVTKVEAYLYTTHTLLPAGGTAILGMWTLTGTGAPGTYSGAPRGIVRSSSWPAGQGRWVTLTSDAPVALGIGVRAITLGPASNTGGTYYMQFAGPTLANPPMLRITYTK